MPKKPEAPVPVVFEAALATGRSCFTLDAEGSGILVLQVPAATVAPLALAMARGELNERTFLVSIDLGKTP